MTAEQIKSNIKSAIQAFAEGNLTENSIELFEKLGYVTERRAPLHKPTFAEFKDTYIGDKKFDEAKAKTKDWKYVDLLFQLSKEEIQKQASLFDTKQVDRTVIETYLFFAIELSHDEYSRTELSVITREVNRLFPMPAMILFKHGKKITVSAINRRLHKRDESKDVLEKVTLIKDFIIENPHRAHIEILFDISFDELRSKHHFTNFVELHNAWQKTLDTKELNKRFYSELFNWYLWAVHSVRFPNDVNDDKDDMVYNSESVIRLLTRLIFVWFIKEKNLVPDSLFELKKLKDILKDFNPQSAETSVYYRAILQNLFFATLNTPMDKDITDENKTEKRRFINTLPKTGNDQYLDQTKYRYQNYFTTPDKALELFASIPFLNGGLFECLDFKDGNKEIRLDGFSSTEKRQAFIPDKLFFAEKHQLDLNTEYGTKNKKYEVEGLINILDSYKFTITENTQLEEEIALDPELLGKVFENLLASYNPETQTTARKQTGSFYTPREIVNYMVDESLLAYFKQSLESIPAVAEEDGISVQETLSKDAQWTFFNPHNEIDIHQGNYPHWQQKDVWYFITFRLGDSVPAKVVEEIKIERELWLKKHPDFKNLTKEDRIEYYRLFSERVENLINAGKGSCILANPDIAGIVSDALHFFENQRYVLDEWVIMPNHVHILVKPLEGHTLPEITHSWKSFTANEINKITGNKGQLWMHESYDHIVRNENALHAIRNYIRQNPVKAKLKEGTFVLPRSKDASELLSRSKDVSEVLSRSKDASGTLGTLETRLRDLFTHVIDLPEFTKSETDVFIKAISEAKILDPACGSGAFPMGILHRLVDLLNKLDPENKHWNELQKQRAIAETAEVFDSGDTEERKIRLDEINKAFDLSMNYPDYARKLFLIENFIYGVDIQQIAIQISKLRFFISLIVDQKVDDNKPNRNILSMPNLETKFVAANTLIGLDKPQQMTLMAGDVERLEKELASIRHKIFFTRKYSAKKALKKKEKEKREELQTALTQSGYTANVAGQIAGWNPFDPMQSAKFFDPETMFGIVPPTSLSEGGKQGGFDVVIGNPPYGFRTVLSKEEKDYFRKVVGIEFSSGDSAELFCKISFDKLVKQKGMLTFIIPKKSLYGDAWEDMRLNYWKKYDLAFILDTGKSFENVLLEASVFGLIKSLSSRNVELAFLESDLTIQKFDNTQKEFFFLDNNTCQIYKVLYPILLFQKIKNNSFETKKITTKLGLAIGQDFFSETKTKHKLLKGIDVEKFNVRSHRYLKNYENLKWENVYAFQKPKVITQVIVSHIENPYPHLKIIACYDSEGIAITNTLMAFETDRDIDLKFLLGYLNSKFISWYAYNFIYARAIRTMHFYDFYIQQLPIPNVEIKDQQPFITLADQILSAKAENPKADTSALEKQIDEMVYKLYELTEEEIKIIEGHE